MNRFLFLLKREWWEWRRAILWVFGVIFFMGLITLIPIHRLSNEFEKWIPEEFAEHADHWTEEDINEFFGELNNSQLPKAAQKGTRIAGIAILGLMGVQSTPVFILVIGILTLFYFADSLFKERDNNSTLYLRSLPINDHAVILSKITAGITGILGISVILAIFSWIFLQLSLITFSSVAYKMVNSVLSQIKLLDLFFDLIVFLVVALIWLSPLLLFLMFISSLVKNRPLIIGVGAPLLLFFVLKLVFGEHSLAMSVGNIFVSIVKMLIEQKILNSFDFTNSHEVFGSFWGYFLYLRTLISLIIAGGFYYLTLFFYRRNILTS